MIRDAAGSSPPRGHASLGRFVDAASRRSGRAARSWVRPLALAGSLAALAAGPNASKDPTFDPPVPVEGAAGDEGGDYLPQVATDGSGHWLLVWYSTDPLGGRIGADTDLLFSRSTDGGASWTPRAPLNRDAATDRGGDMAASLATDRAGHWVVVWQSDRLGRDTDVFVARSSDHGATWTDPEPLGTNAASDSGDDGWPQVATDRRGTWVAVWHSSDTLKGTIGTDLDILVARSTDNGATWTEPRALDSDAASDGRRDELAQIATDGKGQWVAVWQSSDPLGGKTGADADIFVARSKDGGETWSPPEPLNRNAATDAGDDVVPHLSTDRRGSWVAVWASKDSLAGTIGTEGDVLFARSTDGGVRWTDPSPLNSYAGSDFGFDEAPRVTADEAGRWAAVWDTAHPLLGGRRTDHDVAVAWSTDGGATWTAAAPLNQNARGDFGIDRRANCATDGAGRWVCAWASSDSLGGAIGDDFDILTARAGGPVGSGAEAPVPPTPRP